ncbi:MAG: DsbE family thiol:disulfide interchange protein [Hyphomicrobiaceae bacterium]|nr:DsbE family thiol:disulfide interchange protein [Hyphomicrobiaceae bacterium]
MKLSMRTAPLFAFVLIVAALGFALLNDPRKMPSQLIDKPVPGFELAGLVAGDGGLSSKDLTGGIKLVNIFASWCAGCRVEHPTLLRIQREGAIPLYGINWKDKPGDGLKWLKANRSPYLKVGDDMNGRLGIDLGVTGVPETFVIDRTGRIRYRHAGAVTDDVWAETFAPLLAALAKE